MDDIVVVVITEAIVDSDNSNLLSAVTSVEIITIVIGLVVDPLEDSEVAEGSIELRLIVGRPKRTDLTCRLGSAWAEAMVEVSVVVNYCCSVGSYLRPSARSANHY